MVKTIVRLAQHATEAARRDEVVCRRRIVAECLVRTLLVVEALEGVEALDLLAQRARRRIGGVLEQRQVQPLQSAVLLRLTGRDTLRQNARLDHLDGELRQPARPARGKR